ncbi:MAG: cytidylate kinase-like family protein, partial [Anaerolineae bacterium]|nr:cytidylate kinase-like family protein [Anaerolineae bacterium]
VGPRVKRVALKQGIPVQAARLQVEASDRSRRDYLRRDYHVNWDDPELYDLILNSDRLSIEAIVEITCRAVERLGQST